MLFTRRGIRTNTTVFDLTSNETKDKMRLVKQVTKMSKESRKSFDADKPLTYFMGFSCLPVDSMLNAAELKSDLFGINEHTNRDPNYHSNIVDTSKFKDIHYRLDKIKQQEDQTFVVKTIPGKESETIKRKFGRNIGRMNKSVVSDQINSCVGELIPADKGYEDEGLGIGAMAEKEIKSIDTLIVVDTLVSASEFLMVESQYKWLCEELISKQGTRYTSRYITGARHEADSTVNLFRQLLSKLNIKDKNIWEEHLNDNIPTVRYSQKERCYESIFREFQYRSTDKPRSCSLFIPVTYFIFVKNGSLIFKATTIKQEKHIIDYPRLFSTNCSDSMRSIGRPRFNGRCGEKNQTNRQLLPELTSDFMSLEINLVYIPKEFCSRLLKSKLNGYTTTVKSMNIEGSTYIIPKSAIDEGLMEVFYFYPKEHSKLILSTKNDNPAKFTFTVEMDGNINASYYTFLMRNALVNRFAEYYYHSSESKLMEFIIQPYMITNAEEIPFNKLMDNVKEREKSAKALLNNSNITVVSDEMINYEKAVTIMFYLLKKVKIKLVEEHNRQKWNKTPTLNDLTSSIKKYNGMIPENVFEDLYHGRYEFFNVRCESHATLLESLYRIVINNEVEDFQTWCNNLITDVIKDLRHSVNTLLRVSPMKVMIKNSTDKGEVQEIRIIHEVNSSLERLYRMGNLPGSPLLKMRLYSLGDDAYNTVKNTMLSIVFENLIEEILRSFKRTNIFLDAIRSALSVPYDESIMEEVNRHDREELYKDSFTSRIYEYIEANYYGFNSGHHKTLTDRVVNIFKDKTITNLQELLIRVQETVINEYFCSIKE